MSLETIANINVDFYDKKYIMVNAKQYDSESRFIAITCYENGKIFNLSASKHSAYVKYRKADGNGVLNNCKINYKGEVLVELTEQMLAVDGICYVDLTIINKGHALVNVGTGNIVAIDDTPILSTMAFCVNVYETVVDNSEIESSYEYDALNDLIQRAEADYTEVVQLSKSYAIGNAGEIRDNENVDNAKYYCEKSSISADNAAVSEKNAATSESNAKKSETNSKASETNAKASEVNAANSESSAKTSETNAKESEAKASTSEKNAKTSETNAKASETSIRASETNAANSASAAAAAEANAKKSEDNAKTSETNASNYCEIVKSVVDNLSGGFIPIGTVTFAELATVEKATGFTYNISDDFVTDESFREGAGKSYTAGVNVYCTANGQWDCLGGASFPTATVDEVKGYLGI